MAYISCTTYNHANYIKDALKGFYIQKTNFPFAAIVIDDASTDNEQEVLLRFVNEELDQNSIEKEETDDYIKVAGLHKNNQNCTFVILLLKYNHVSVRKAKSPYFEDFYKGIKYAAICEGDDYWTDPYKLQKQVDILETHPEYTMVCNRTKLYSEKAKAYFGENYCYNNDRVVKTKDVIYRSGLFISTCSIVYRKEIQENYPQYCKQCVVGDYPLQIMAAMKGSIYYFNNTMSVYRIDNRHSWMSRQHWNSVSDYNLKRIESMINMFEGFSHDYSKYSFSFQNKIAQYLISQSPSVSQNKGKDTIYYKNYFQQYYGTFTLYWKFVDKLKNINIPKVRALSRYCLLLIFKRFSVKQVIHN